MRITLLLAPFLFLAAAALPLSAGDEFVTLSDGRTLVLHDDYTWDIKGGKSTALPGETTVNVYGDKNIVLHEDRTWDFADTAGNALSRRTETLKSVSATATAGRETLDEAREAARGAAVKKIVQQLRPRTDTLTVSEESLARCIGLAASFVTVKQGRLHGKGWTVSLKAALTKDQISGVLSCAAQGVAP
ncbi:MAG TPA: hypothetical protein VKF42_10780 [Chitinivibrionales bacterium]|jgi:hypothetical protein|nr:hypothetical protein [Chitinivibrionales bacterium]